MASSSDLDARLLAFRESERVITLGTADRIRLTGEDRLRFLGGLVTCDVKSLAAGHGTYGFFTDIKGRLLADVVVLAGEDDVWLELPAGTGTAIEAHLTKYRIVDRVAFEVQLDVPWRVTYLDPQRAPGDTPDEAPWQHRAVTRDGDTWMAFRDLRLGVPGHTLIATTNDVPTAAEAESAPSDEEQDALVEAFEAARIRAGRPRFGIDMGPTNFPQETGLGDETISYTKGCYLGQEIVARIHYRGGVNRRLVGLRFDASDGDASLVGRELRLDERSVGSVTSAVVLDDAGVLGLAIVHKRAEDEQQVVVGPAEDVEGETDQCSAIIMPLPFKI